jgi:hypothetical protein
VAIVSEIQIEIEGSAVAAANIEVQVYDVAISTLAVISAA